MVKYTNEVKKIKIYMIWFWKHYFELICLRIQRIHTANILFSCTKYVVSAELLW